MHRPSFFSKLHTSFWRFGLFASMAAATPIAVIMTTLDWSANPGEVFRGPEGTHWSIVFDTVVSWFLPAFVYLFVMAAAGHLLWTLIRRKLQA